MLDVKMNFKEKYQNNDQLLRCNLCFKDDLDDQSHVILCSAVKNNQDLQFNYSNLFSKDINILKKAITEFDEAKIVSNFGKERQTGAMSTNVTSVSPKIKFSIPPSLISIFRAKLIRYNSSPVVSASGFTSHFADPVPEFTSTTEVLFSSSTSHIAFLPLQSRQSPSMELFYFYSSRKRPYLLNRMCYRAEFLHGESTHKDLHFMFSTLLQQTNRFVARTPSKSPKIRAFLPLKSRLLPSKSSLVSSSVPGFQPAPCSYNAVSPLELWLPSTVQSSSYNKSCSSSNHLTFEFCICSSSHTI